MNDGVVKEFHQLFYHSQVWASTRWLGVQVLKYPSDLLVYQEIIFAADSVSTSVNVMAERSFFQ
jgi:cephalosporin hydroxylase